MLLLCSFPGCRRHLTAYCHCLGDTVQPVGSADISSSVSVVRLDSSDSVSGSVTLILPRFRCQKAGEKDFWRLRGCRAKLIIFFPPLLPGVPGAGGARLPLSGYGASAWCRGDRGIKSTEFHPVPEAALAPHSARNLVKKRGTHPIRPSETGVEGQRAGVARGSVLSSLPLPSHVERQSRARAERLVSSEGSQLPHVKHSFQSARGGAEGYEFLFI